MSRRYTISLSRNQLVFGMVGALLFASGTAYGLSVGNTPDTGYLICVNQKSRTLTYPGKLSCPSGSSSLVLGAQGPAGQDGAEGPMGPIGLSGPRGAQGPEGSSISSVNYYKVLDSQDVVIDGVITDAAKAKVFIVGIVKPSDLPLGYYRLDAHLSGLWSETVFNLASKPFIKCYFQTKKDYDSGSGRYVYGAGKADYVSWTGITMNVQGYVWFLSANDDPTYLVCNTTAIIKQFGGMIEALSAGGSIQMKG
jgi:hypothetical protein